MCIECSVTEAGYRRVVLVTSGCVCSVYILTEAGYQCVVVGPCAC